MNGEHCAGCRFFGRPGDVWAVADCRRFPPPHPGVTDADGNTPSTWPQVRGTGWCGEWKSAAAGDPPAGL